MDSPVVRANTVKLHFGSKSRNPSNQEMFNFFRKQGWDSEMLSAMYREDYSLMLKFQSKRIMQQVLVQLGPTITFVYDNGTEAEVAVSAAGGRFKYIRVFGLLPEVEDRFISAAFEKYGTIQQMVRERFNADSGFPIWTGVRGIHMEMKEDIPAQVHVQHIKARVYYDGMQTKCFRCGSTEHLKAECPKRTSVNNRLASKSDGNGTDEGNSSGPSIIPILRPEAFPGLPGKGNSDQSNQPNKQAVNMEDKIQPQPNGGQEDNEGDEGWKVVKTKEQLKRSRGLNGNPTDPDGSGQAQTKKLFTVPAGPTLTQLQQRRSRSTSVRKTASSQQQEGSSAVMDTTPPGK